MAFTEIKIKYGGSYTVRFHAEDEGTLKVWEEKRHMHPEYELHMILDGQCCLSCDEGDMELDRGTAVLIAPGSYHSSKQYSRSHLRLSLAVSPGDRRASEQLDRILGGHTVQFPLSPVLMDLGKLFLEESFDRQKMDIPVQQALLLVIGTELFRVLGFQNSHSVRKNTEKGDIRSDIIDNFFQEQIAEKRGRDVLADQLGISRRQTDRVLAEKYGKTYREKLLETRMDRAGQLLRNSEKSIPEISEEIGYSSENAFFKQFRRYYQMTPGAYRSENPRM